MHPAILLRILTASLFIDPEPLVPCVSVFLNLRVTPSLLERLTKPEMQLRPTQTKDRRRTIKIYSVWTTLRNQELRRIQQKSVIDR
jgi:hypothetical protein